MKVFATLTTLLGVAYAAPATQMGYASRGGVNSLRQSSSFSAAVKDVMGDKASMQMYSSSQMSPKDMSLRQMAKMTDRQMSREDMAGRQMSQIDMSGRQMDNRQISQMDMSGRQMDNRQISQMDMSGRHMDNRQTSQMDMNMDDRKMSSRQNMSSKKMAGRQMSPMAGRQQMANRQMSGKQMSGQQMSGQQMSFDYMNNALDSQTQGNQYYKQDQRGNYVYGYSSDVAEKFEEGNAETGVKGHYTFIDANGLNKRVDYIADKEGFRIIHDNNAGSRFKREVKPDLVRTKMTSYRDMSLLRDDSQDMYRMDGRNMIGRGMSSNMNMMGQEMSSNMMGQDMMGQNMMGQNMYDMTRMSPYTDMRLSEMMTPNMRNSNMMSPNMRNSNMMSPNMMTPNMMSSNNIMSPNMMSPNMRNSNMYMMSPNSNNMMTPNGQLLGQRDVMAQRMEVERIDDSLLNRMF